MSDIVKTIIFAVEDIGHISLFFSMTCTVFEIWFGSSVHMCVRPLSRPSCNTWHIIWEWIINAYNIINYKDGTAMLDCTAQSLTLRFGSMFSYQAKPSFEPSSWCGERTAIIFGPIFRVRLYSGYTPRAPLASSRQGDGKLRRAVSYCTDGCLLLVCTIASCCKM